MIWSHTVASGLKSYSCSRKAIRMSFRNRTRPPESELSFPARILRRLVLPVPFGAIRAILSPSLTLKPICSKRIFGP